MVQESLKAKDFELNVLYQDDKTGNSINYLPEGKLQDQILLQVMGLDNLNSQLDRESDGYFDFIDGYYSNELTGGKLSFLFLNHLEAI